jgi:hypothetical protein
MGLGYDNGSLGGKFVFFVRLCTNKKQTGKATSYQDDVALRFFSVLFFAVVVHNNQIVRDGD